MYARNRKFYFFNPSFDYICSYCQDNNNLFLICPGREYNDMNNVRHKYFDSIQYILEYNFENILTYYYFVIYYLSMILILRLQILFRYKKWHRLGWNYFLSLIFFICFFVLILFHLFHLKWLFQTILFIYIWATHKACKYLNITRYLLTSSIVYLL